MMQDFAIIYAGGRALLEGASPYSVPGYFYPLPFSYLMALLALLPMGAALAVWLMASFGMLVAFFRRQFWQWLLYVPIFHLFFLSGQNELLWWSLAMGLRRNMWGALLAACITMKPQNALVLLPYHLLDWLRHDRRTLGWFLLFTALLWGLPLLWWPGWVGEWLMAAPTDNWLLKLRSVPGLFSLVAISPMLLIILLPLCAVVAVWGLLQKREAVTRAALMLTTPLGLFYTQSTLLGTAPAWLLVPLSLFAFGFAWLTQTFIGFITVPVAVIIWQLNQPADAARRSASTLVA